MELPKAYEPQQYEDDIYTRWEQSGYFNPDNLPASKETGDDAETYTITLPPPNATGTLHLGHAMYVVQDIMIRYARMQGKQTLWLPGTDHAAIATQSKVESLIFEAEGKTRHDLGRAELVKRVEEYVEDSKSTIRHQLRKMGFSLDWSRERFTLEPLMIESVQKMFMMMAEDGLVYRGDRIVNWDPKLQTTVADDEQEYTEERAPFYYFKYGPFTIGTARPETKFGDKYVVVHPDDERYSEYEHGQQFELEWINGKITATLIKDKAADPEMGTGAMTITPWHDATDFEIAERHNLNREQIIDLEGRLLPIAGEFFGMLIEEARPKIVELLKEKGLLVKVDEDYIHNVSMNYRGGGVIEPQILPQWFVAVDKPVVEWKGKQRSLKEIAIDVVKNGDIHIVPDRFNKTYFHWMENLHDWCISRQLWYGHRIPAYYDLADERNKNGIIQFMGKGGLIELNDEQINDLCNIKKIEKELGWSELRNYYIGSPVTAWIENEKIPSKQPIGGLSFAQTYYLVKKGIVNWTLVKEKCTGIVTLMKYPKRKLCEPIVTIVDKEIPASAIQEIDVLDTWFSSGMWTFSTLNWLEDFDFEKRQAKPGTDLARFHPTTVMETGYDILFFWVARMILMTTYGMREIPFGTVYLHGLVRDRDGQKMSKSKDNGIDPLEMSDKYGTDAVRLSLVIGTSPGNDQRLYEEKIAGYRNFVNKIWNVSRYVLMNSAGESQTATHEATSKEGVTATDGAVDHIAQATTLADRWIVSRLNHLIVKVSTDLDTYQYGVAAEKIYEFLWSEFADWYIEITKFQPNPALTRHVLETVLKLLHPYVPYVTERIWKELGHKNLLMIEQWPTPKTQLIDAQLEKRFIGLQNIIVQLRDIRAKHDIKYTQSFNLFPQSEIKKEEINIIEKLARIKIDDKGGTEPKTSDDVIKVNNDIFWFDAIVTGLIDKDRAIKKVNKEIDAKKKYIDSLKKKLSNEKYLQNAPSELVAETKQKLKQERAQLTALEVELKMYE